MFDRKKMTITFPHIITGDILLGRKYTWDDVRGGSKKLADLGIDRNSFFGGQIVYLGLIADLGFYACPHFISNKILGFYVHDVNSLTDKGKRALTERFSDCTVIFETVVEQPKGITKEEIENRNNLREELKKYGIAPEMVTHTNAEGLKAMLDAVISGEAKTKMAVQEEDVYTPLEENPTIVKGMASTKRTRVM